MKKWMMKVLIFFLQFIGVILLGIGLSKIWSPLALIYAGVVEIAFGHLLYRAMESEESEK